ncbi:MAG: 2Fe-2S iron-sulfur cluster-binding protein [Pigmentiphaga sp.]|uniref:2Fe-2S iron-sulfur cluster-binding protein n=1 Tax=Pigmentiphaga sp. TaxID=1977564 RepID=UPI0029ABBDB1|nr:2Fe-2S iron-sulfur cluster-binding protein [Pigmentiphaga sp.]MDX3905190.1 2Fe-2S iron-sulfur cluster-binding protein [Pigmentiphaga sp.]
MQYTIRIDQRDIEFPCDAGQSVLDGALAAGYEIPYSCRTGICGSCRGRIVGGESRGGTGEGVLGDEERRDGHVLLCQAKPCSDLQVAVRDIARRDPQASKTVAAKVYRLTRAAHDVTVLQLRFPAGTRVRFKAGQYLHVQMEDGTIRHFSMANAPQQNDGVELHVRHVPGGKFSEYLASSVSTGQILDVSLPYGDFYLRDSDKPAVLVASGTGFAPIKSVVEDAVKRKLSRPMTLYWGTRRAEDMYMADLPRKWADKYPWFKFVPVLSDDPVPEGWDGRTGFVHQAVLDDYASLADCEVYACGAPAMISAARQSFVHDRGLPQDAFYCDAFVPMAAAA